MKILFFIVYTILFITVNLTAQQNDYKNINGPYLGEVEPEEDPKIFAPGLISMEGSNEFCASFSPDLKEFYFNRGMIVMVCRLEENGWTKPEPASFSENYRTHEAHITLDNKNIFFGGSRPPQPYGIWLTELSDTGLTPPQRMWDGMYVTSSKNGNIYFGVESPAPAHIVLTKQVDGNYIKPAAQDIPFVNSEGKSNLFHPGIAPDDSFIVFDDNKQLYVSIKKKDGCWGNAVSLFEYLGNNLGVIPSITPDGMFLFFCSNGDIYWVSTKIIERIKQN